MTATPAVAVRSVRGRLVSLDLIRGFCLLSIVVTHLSLGPTLLDVLTTRGELWVTAAEVFFFISGLLLGHVRGPLFSGGKGRLATKKVWRRAAVLYVAVVAMTALLALGEQAVRSAGIAAGKAGPVNDRQVLWNTITLGQVGTDILVTYTVLLLLTPLVLLLLRRGAWPLVLLVAATLYVLAAPGAWHLLYQVYFFTGLVAGYHLGVVQQMWHRLVSRRPFLPVALVVLAVATLLTSMALDLVPVLVPDLHWSPTSPLYDALFQAGRTGLLRPLAFAVWIGASFLLVRRAEAWIVRTAGPVLLPVGREPLYSYLLHLPLVAVLRALPVPGGLLASTCLAVASVALICLLVRHRVLARWLPH